jgi:ribosomal protein S17E
MEKEGVEVQMATLEAGHCVSFTAVKQVARFIIEAVKGDFQSNKSAVAKEISKDEVKDVFVNV